MPTRPRFLLVLAGLLIAACGGGEVSREDLITSARAQGMRSSQASCLADELLDEFDQEDLAVVVAADDIESAADRLGARKVDKIVRMATACGPADPDANDPGEGDPATTEPDVTEPDITEPTDPVDQTTVLTAPDLAADRPGLTRQAPVPFKVVGAVGAGWTLRMDGYAPNANAAVEAANEFNEPPPPGKQYAVATVNAAFGGPADKATLLGAVFFKAVGPRGLAYDSTDCVVVLADDIDIFRDVFAGGSLSGDVCFVVDAADAVGLVLYAETYDPEFNLDSTFFALA